MRLGSRNVPYVAAVWLVACSGKSSPTGPTRPAGPITVSGPATLAIGETAQLTARAASGEDVTPRVTWATNDRTIATVSNTGLVTGIRIGPVELTATDRGFAASLDMTVHVVEISSPIIASCGRVVAPGSYTVARNLAITTAAGHCLTVGASDVRLDCENHSVTGIRVSDASNVFVTNCQGVTGSSAASQAVALVERSTNVTFANNTLLEIVLMDGNHNRVVGNVIDGGYDGSGGFVGSDDGVLLIDEANDTIQGNTIRNVWDAAVEGVDAVSNTLIADNEIANTGSVGIGSYWCTAWTGNTVARNRMSRVPGLVRFVYGVSVTKCHNPSTVGAFADNQFIGNTLRDGVQGAQAAMWFDFNRSLPREAVSGNVIQGNDMGDFPGPQPLPLLGFIDGGGNVCNPFTSTFCDG